MKKVVCFGLCFLILLCSFVFCFADSVDIPVMTLLGSRDSKSVSWFSNNTPEGERWLWSSDPEVFGGLIKIGDSNYYLFISPNPNSVAYVANINGTDTPRSLSSFSDGYYYISGSISIYSTYSHISEYPIGTLVTNIVSSFVDANSVSFNLSDIIDGAIAWLSAVVDGVLQAPLLLFLILFSFVGIAVGLLFRFKRG